MYRIYNGRKAISSTLPPAESEVFPCPMMLKLFVFALTNAPFAYGVFDSFNGHFSVLSPFFFLISAPFLFLLLLSRGRG
jgi:glucan phosphoethanolaminetransferase (alkaline phosphatase superfamily)